MPSLVIFPMQQTDMPRPHKDWVKTKILDYLEYIVSQRTVVKSNCFKYSWRKAAKEKKIHFVITFSLFVRERIWLFWKLCKAGCFNLHIPSNPSLCQGHHYYIRYSNNSLLDICLPYQVIYLDSRDHDCLLQFNIVSAFHSVWYMVDLKHLLMMVNSTTLYLAPEV